MDVSIRQAVLSDAEEIARLTAHLGYDVTPAEVARRLAPILAHADHHVLIAGAAGGGAGWVGAAGGAAGWLHASVVNCLEADAFVMIDGLVVDRHSRGRGVGTALLQRAEDWAATLGYPLVRLWSTSSRTAAHRFYEHRGYTNIKTQYAFVKAIGDGAQALRTLVPRVEE
jgi:GNAT superfamily N-acetyltransferase